MHPDHSRWEEAPASAAQIAGGETRGQSEQDVLEYYAPNRPAAYICV